MLLFKNLNKIISLEDIFHYKIISCNEKMISHTSFDLWDLSYLATSLTLCWTTSDTVQHDIFHYCLNNQHYTLHPLPA